MAPIELTFASTVAMDAATVWRAVTTMRGVNAELGPWLRMTDPTNGASLADVVPGTTGFRSWVLLLRLVPLDRHSFGFEGLSEGEEFREASTSWLQRAWRHRRSVRAGPVPGSAVVTDVLVFTPRLGFTRPVLARVVRAVFTHRHRRLRARYGEAALDA